MTTINGPFAVGDELEVSNLNSLLVQYDTSDPPTALAATYPGMVWINTSEPEKWWQSREVSGGGYEWVRIGNTVHIVRDTISTPVADRPSTTNPGSGVPGSLGDIYIRY